MNKTLSQKQIGRRVAEIRKVKGLSQEELAKTIKISRPSLAQIELGNRSVDVLELQKFSQVLGFSLDDFMSADFSVSEEPSVEYEKKPKKMEERIAVPMLQLHKFKNVLLYILERCAGKPNVGETVLYKLLYFADFNYYERYEEHLTGAMYRKLPYGPVPQKLDSIIKQMIDEVLMESRQSSMLLTEREKKPKYDRIIDALEGKTEGIDSIGLMSGQNPMAQALCSAQLLPTAVIPYGVSPDKQLLEIWDVSLQIKVF